MIHQFSQFCLSHSAGLNSSSARPDLLNINRMRSDLVGKFKSRQLMSAVYLNGMVGDKHLRKITNLNVLAADTEDV